MKANEKNSASQVVIEEHDDDKPIGRVVSRREMVGILAGVGVGTLFLAGCGPVLSAVTGSSSSDSSTSNTATASSSTAATATSTAAATAAVSASTLACVVVPELTEGPYFVDEKINRSDIRSDPTTGTVKEGVPLKLTFNVAKVGTSCTAYAGAIVDIWHCDATGLYSDESANNTVGQKFLRGYQVADANGQATFSTIYPGWYQGRTVHIHFKIRSSLDATQSTTFTSQLFFDDAISDQIFTLSPYSSKGSNRSVRNDNDNIYKAGGSVLQLNLTKDGDGYAAVFNIGVTKA